MGNWLGVQLEQARPNVDAIGAFIEVRTEEQQTTREVVSGGGHGGGSLGPVHFGLGNSPRAEVRVTWPDGEVGPWRTLESGQVVTITRDEPS